MPKALRRTLSMLLPLPLQRRRITQAAEMILSNIDLYASIKVLIAGNRIVMEMRSPAAVPAAALESIRRYVARKLDQVLGLSLRPDQIYLVSLPPTDAARRPALSTNALKLSVQALPQWVETGLPAVGEVAAAALSRSTSADPDKPVDGVNVSKSDAPDSLRFNQPANCHIAARDERYSEGGLLEIATGFANTHPLQSAAQAA